MISQINPQDIDIVRDKFGVPHIYAKTDREVAYGLAWAHAEDDFKTIQIGYLAGNNLKIQASAFRTSYENSNGLDDNQFLSAAFLVQVAF